MPFDPSEICCHFMFSNMLHVVVNNGSIFRLDRNSRQWMFISALMAH